MKGIFLIRRKIFLSIVSLLACCTATNAQVNWTQYSGNPVLELSSSGAWDQGTVFLPSVIPSGDTLENVV